MMDWLAKTYVNALNVIHYMHDKYCYEAIEMALHDRDILRTHGLRHRRPVARRRQPVGDQVRQGEADPRRARPDRRLRDRGRVPLLRQQRRSRRRHRQDAGVDDDEQDPQVPDLPRRGAHAVGADDHVERRLRQGDRQHAGRPQEGRAVRARRQSVERPRHARRAGGADVGRQDPLRRCRGRHLAHALGRAVGARQRGASGIDARRRRARRVFLAAAASTSTSTCSTARRCRTRWSIRRSIRSSRSACPATR